MEEMRALRFSPYTDACTPLIFPSSMSFHFPDVPRAPFHLSLSLSPPSHSPDLSSSSTSSCLDSSDASVLVPGCDAYFQAVEPGLKLYNTMKDFKKE